MKFWVAVVGVMVGLCGSAQAGTVISPESGTSYPYQRWADRAYTPTPDALTVYDGAPSDGAAHCNGYPVLGCASLDEGWVFVAITSNKWVAHGTFLHELGHIYGDTASEHYAEVYERCARFGLAPPEAWPLPRGFRPLCRRILTGSSPVSSR